MMARGEAKVHPDELDGVVENIVRLHPEPVTFEGQPLGDGLYHIEWETVSE